jgi:hypothetical protein
MNKWEQEWTINFGSGDIVIPPKKTVFTLHKHVADRIEYYHMEISSGDLCLGWEDAEFIKFGKAPLVWPRALQLPPWPAVHDPDIAQLYQDNITEVLANVATANTLRLEGEVEFDGEMEPAARAAAMARKGSPVPGVYVKKNALGAPPVLVGGNHTFFKRVVMIIGEKAVFDEATQEESDLLLVPISTYLGLAQGPIDDGTAHGNGKPKP